MKLLTKTPPKTDSTLPSISVPDHWNKLKRRQLLYLAWLLNQSFEQNAFKVIALAKLSGIKILEKFKVDENDKYWFLIKQKREKFYITAGLYNQLLKSITFTTEAPQLTNQLIPSFSLLPSYFSLLPFFKFHGPEESCYNITYAEMVHAQLAYTNFNNTKEAKYLNHLVAILYRPRKKNLNKKHPDWNGDTREPFSAFTYQSRAKWFRFLPFKLKYAIFIFFSGCMGHMADEHPLCFAAPTKISSNPKKANPAKSLIDLVPVVTKGDPTKNEALYKTPAWDVFDSYEAMRTEQEARK